jgi:hypothetical protein
MDLSLLFLEKSFQLIRTRGLIGLICTSQWLTADYGTKIREFLATGKLHEIMDFGSLPVFKDASTYPAVLILSDTPSKDLNVKKILTRDQLHFDGITKIRGFSVALEALSEKPWSLGALDITRCPLPISPLSKFGKAFIGTKSGLNEAFVLTKAEAKKLKIEKKIILPYAYRGGEVESFKILEPESVIIYPYIKNSESTPKLMTEKYLKENFPNAYAHLLSKKTALQKRQDSRKYYAKGTDWYRHLRAGTFQIVENKKLVVKGISLECNVGLFNGPSTFDGARCPCIIIEQNKPYSEIYFVGILNSKLASYYLKSICPPKLNGYIEFTARALTNFPIRVVDFSRAEEKKIYDDIVHCAISLLELNASENSDTRRIEHMKVQLDSLVYTLYGLTTEEIRLIEGNQHGDS